MAKEKKYSIKDTDKETLQKWYHLLTLGRQIDDKAPNYLKQALGWSYHAPYAGHDGIQLAIGQIFEKEKDHLFPYYRDMLTTLSAGLSTKEILMNGISKDEDVASGGRHMSNHFAKPEWNIHNVSSAVANHTLHAVGVARAIKKYKGEGVAISSHGESSAAEGYVYEAINGASREKLPVIFVMQDNRYGISVPREDQTANRRSSDNFRGIRNLHIIHCDGKNIFDSMNAMEEAKKHAKEKQEPVIVHASVVRMRSHSNSDRQELYRDDYELEKAQKMDPLKRFRKELIDAEIFTEDDLDKMDEEAKKEISKEHKKVIRMDDPSPESIHDYVLPEPYKPEKYKAGTHEYTGDKKKLVEALNETLKAEFRHNEHTYLWGQDVAYKEKGGVFNVTKGMLQEFGNERIWNAPIAEDFIVGTANGMSRYDEKIHIVIEGAEFADYFWPAMEQFVEMTHEYWRTKGKFAPNVVIRLASGGYIGGGLYHSQTIEGAMSTFPGIRIVYPSFADDAAGLLRTAMRSSGPTLFLEPKALYNAPRAATPIPDDFEVPFGKARLRREGKHLSIITFGNTTHQCMDAAEKLAEENNWEADVIDLRSLMPLDKASIIDSVKKTNRVLLVHEDKVHAGFGGELAGIIADEAFTFLDAPIKRVGSTFTPVGFNPILEQAILPNKDRIYDAAVEIMKF